MKIKTIKTFITGCLLAATFTVLPTYAVTIAIEWPEELNSQSARDLGIGLYWRVFENAGNPTDPYEFKGDFDNPLAGSSVMVETGIFRVRPGQYVIRGEGAYETFYAAAINVADRPDNELQCFHGEFESQEEYDSGPSEGVQQHQVCSAQALAQAAKIFPSTTYTTAPGAKPIPVSSTVNQPQPTVTMRVDVIRDGDLYENVPTEYGSENNEVAPPMETLESAPYTCRVVKIAANDVLNIRQSYSANSGITAMLAPNTDGIPTYKCTKLNNGNTWCNVTHPQTGINGWVSAKYLSCRQN